MTHSRGCVCCRRRGLNAHTCAHTYTHHVERSKKCVKGLVMDDGRGTGTMSCLLFRVSFYVNWLHLATFLTFCHYCHFTWEPGWQRGSTDSRLTPDAVHLIDISTDNDPFLHCSGGYIGRRWEGANTGEMSHQGSQRGVKPCLTSAGSVAPLCPLCAPGKMI